MVLRNRRSEKARQITTNNQALNHVTTNVIFTNLLNDQLTCFGLLIFQFVLQLDIVGTRINTWLLSLGETPTRVPRSQSKACGSGLVAPHF